MSSLSTFQFSMCIVVGLYEGKEFGKVLARSRRSVCHKIFLRFQKNDEINFKIIKKNEAHNLIRILHLIKRFYLKWVLIQLLLLKAMTLSAEIFQACKVVSDTNMLRGILQPWCFLGRWHSSVISKICRLISISFLLSLTN